VTVGQPGEFYSEPFDFSGGGVLFVEASDSVHTAYRPIEYVLEGSEDKTYWAEIASGVVLSGENVEVPCRGDKLAWARVRLRAFGGPAHLSLRRFPRGRDA
jgi:hypothetical protein